MDAPPPRSDAAERFVAGTLLAAPHVIPDIAERLDTEDFGSDACRRVFAEVLAMHRRGDPIDPATVAESLRAAGQLADVGGAAGLADLYSTAGVGVGWEYWADIVKSDGSRRRIARLCIELARDANDRTAPPAWLYERMAAAAHAGITGQAGTDPDAFSAKVLEVLADVDEAGGGPPRRHAIEWLRTARPGSDRRLPARRPLRPRRTAGRRQNGPGDEHRVARDRDGFGPVL